MPIAMDGGSLDGGAYMSITDVARNAPAWLDSVLSAWSTYGLALFAVLMLVAWWRARPGASPQTAMALAAPSSWSQPSPPTP